MNSPNATLAIGRAVLVFLSINDVYSLTPVAGKGGIAELATALKQERASIRAQHPGAHIITTVNGDFLAASAAANKFRGAHMVELFGLLGVDAVVLGNHEFDYGEAVISDRIAQSSFPWFGASNVQSSSIVGLVDTDLQHLALQCDDGIEMDPLRLGLFGLVTPQTPGLSYPNAETVFTDPTEAAVDAVARLDADGADVIVGLTHLLNVEDKAVAKAAPSVSLLLGGHDHMPYTELVGKTLIHKSGQNAYWLGRVSLEVEVREERSGVDGAAVARTASVWHDWGMRMVRGFAPDPAVDELIRTKFTVTIDDPDVPLPVVITEHLQSLFTVVRSAQSNYGSLVADAMRSVLGAQLGLINGGFLRGDHDFPAGHVLTRGDVASDLPFTSPGVVVEIKGRDLKRGLEQQLRFLPETSGAFPHVSGFRVEFEMTDNDERPARITGMWATRSPDTISDDEQVPLEDDETYTLATSEFIWNGGDDATAFSEATLWPPSRRGSLVCDLVFEYLDLDHGLVLTAPTLADPRMTRVA